MTEPSLQLGGGNWAGKSGNLLAYHKVEGNFYANDLTFNRASTGTIVNADGLIEEVPYNKLTYSEQFDNAVWQKAASSVVSGFTSFDGTTNAFKLVEDSANAWHKVFDNSSKPSLTLGTSVTMSIFAKSAERDIIKLTPYIGTKYIWANFNLSTGSVGMTEGTETSTQIENFGNGWYKCSISFVASATNVQSHYSLAASNGTALTYQGDGTSGIYIYGAQLNSGSTAKPYYPTTTRLNMPRVTYKDSANGSLLLEPQRTNLLTQSEAFDDSYWTKSQVTITANDTTSPDGTTNADKIVETANNSEHIFYRTGISTIGTISLYAKGDNSNRLLQVRRDGGSGTNAWAWFNLDSGAVVSQDAGVASIESLDNNWFRCIFTPTSATGTIVFAVGNGGTTRSVSYQGDGTSGVYLWGAQLEQGSYSTSYIPTSGSTVTRLQDASGTTGLSDVIGQTEGTLYIDVDFTNHNQIGVMIELSNGAANRVLIYHSSSTIICYANATVFSYTQSTNERLKIAFAYKSGDSALYVNGVQNSVSSATLTYTGLSQLNVGSNYTNGQPVANTTRQAQLYNTRLSNAELATLTTL